jgi:hypothetical protein
MVGSARRRGNSRPGSRVVRRVRALAALIVIVVGCGAPVPPRPLDHDAYVWQRAWTGAVVDAVAGAPAELHGLRVLAVEVGAGAPAWPAVDAAALARAARPVTAVVRIDGSRPIAGLSLAILDERLAAWRAAGVRVVGIEIDHDCATAALADYARWLSRARPSGLRWSITALPTWAGAPALADVAAAVDELVVQVHAIRAPTIFDPIAARAGLAQFAAAVPDRPLRVALPTYAVAIGGTTERADPREVAAFVRDLERAPIEGVTGVVWFRLPVATDLAAWPAATLRAVITGAPLDDGVATRLVARGPALFDVVIANRGALDAPWPAVRVTGAIAAADLVGGYAREGDRWTPPARVVRPGAEIVIGWVRGQELHVDAP